MHQCQERREEGKKRKKSEEKERDRDTEVDLPNPNPFQAIDAPIGDEEQNENRKRTNKKETKSGPQTKLPWTIRSPPTNHRDHTVGLFF